MRTPALLLGGSGGPPRELTNGKGVAAAVRDAEVTSLSGQQHAVMWATPELIAREAVRFLEAQCGGDASAAIGQPVGAC